MKIYFSGSIRGGRGDADLYSKLIRELKKHGEVLTEHIGAEEIANTLSDREIHDRDLRWLEEADLVIAEVTTPSLGVGYEIGRAVAMDKKVVCLYREDDGKPISAMIIGSPDITGYRYSDLASAKKLISDILG